jgi:hypothetical protein
VIISLLGCKSDVNYENDEELCILLSEMLESDQSIRKLPEFTNPYFKILDSIKSANSITEEEYAKLGNHEQVRFRKMAMEIARNRPKVSKSIHDSLWNIQSAIDHKNTQLLIDITKKRGWVSKDGLGCSEDIAPVLIFRHAPEEFWDELKPLIDKEYAEKRMTVGDYEFIANHLKGRPMDFGNGIKVRTVNE